MLFLLNFLFLSEHPLFPQSFAEPPVPEPCLPFCSWEGHFSSSRPLIKVRVVPGSNPPGSLMDLHTSENAVVKLLKWNASPAVAITDRSDFLAGTPGSSATAY